MLVSSPTVMVPSSPRMTALYQTLHALAQHHIADNGGAVLTFSFYKADPTGAAAAFPPAQKPWAKLPFSNTGDLPAVMGGTHDPQVRGAHHKVHMGDGVVGPRAFSSSLVIFWPPSRQDRPRRRRCGQAAFSSKSVL